ncbi:MAG TPA: hypothetical protein H9803_02445 [Candidatus Ligilactobacillus excrementavium]|nr:hypothetical protein [Candidatus Ligilactobacillus excrementavium]
MKKNFLIGFGVGMSALACAYIYWHQLTASKQDQLAVKLDDKFATGRDKAADMEAKAADFAGTNVQAALSSLKDSTSKLKGHLNSARQNFDDESEVMQDDIVIDHRSAFSKVKQNAEQEGFRPTEKFYPHNN